jgi:two-component system, LuxR family, response regulator FixJ
MQIQPASAEPKVFVVDDDPAVREWLEALLRAAGHSVVSFASAAEFLAAYAPNVPGCLVLDIRMPEMSGLELQARLKERAATLPVIFITSHGDVPMAVEAMRAGAVDFLLKPFEDQDLLDRVRQALALDAASQAERSELDAIRARIKALTPRELEVMRLVVEGKANKIIATDLSLSQRTVEIHRARVMDKMGAGSLAHLVRMVLDVEGT